MGLALSMGIQHVQRPVDVHTLYALFEELANPIRARSRGENKRLVSRPDGAVSHALHHPVSGLAVGDRGAFAG